MDNFLQITPFVYVPDIESALEFFSDVLGFEVSYRQGDYAYIQRETVAFRLMQAEVANAGVVGNRRFAYYIDVRDVDALYAELKEKLVQLREGDVHGPAEKGYGQRELLVVAPDGNLIAFGQPISSA